MRLPTRLAFTAFRVAVAGTVACSGSTDGGSHHPADAAPDVPMEAAGDASADVAADAADSATSDVTPTDASVVDASTDASDGGGDECATYCGPITPDASCPGFVCDIVECSLEAGCEPFV